MPACFQYLRNGEPLDLPALDDRICREVLGVEPDPENYHPAFELGVSFPVACGWSLECIVESEDTHPDTRRIAAWLIAQNVTTDAWRSVE